MRRVKIPKLRVLLLVILTTLGLSTYWPHNPLPQRQLEDAQQGTDEVPLVNQITITVTKTITVFKTAHTTAASMNSNTSKSAAPNTSLRPISDSLYITYYESIEKNSSLIPHYYTSNIPNFILRTWKTNNRIEIINKLNDSTTTTRTDTTATSTTTTDIPTWFKSWDTLNPTHLQLIFNDKDSDRFVQGFFSDWVTEAYFRLPRVVMRSDLVRYLMLYKFGGVYSDLDTSCLRPIHEWTFGVKEVGFFAGVENARGNRDNINQWTIGSAQHHPLIAKVIHRVVSTIHKASDDDLKDPQKLLYITGPGIWKPTVHEYLAEKGATVEDVSFLWDGFRMFDDVMVFGKTLLSPLNAQNPKAFSIHYGTGKLAGGWKTVNDTSVLYIPNHLAPLRDARLYQKTVAAFRPRHFIERIERNQVNNRIEIPKQIAQVHYTTNISQLSPFYQQIQSSWRLKNPGYTYTLYDDVKMDAFVKSKCSDVEKKLYFKTGLLHQRIEVFKLLWLLKVGGVFVDLDTECLRPINDWRLGKENIGLVLGMQDQTVNPPRIAKHTIMAAPRHSFLQSYWTTVIQPFFSSKSKKQMRASLPYKTLHHEWFETYTYSYLKTRGGDDMNHVGTNLSWEAVVQVGDVVLYGQAMFRPDDLDRNISMVKNYDFLWHQERTWLPSWPELEAKNLSRGAPLVEE
ncbi:nucleotide-diphospho-sugar transferase [Obelidium mucronatum]|nr:nucleotide-diphospho-sugar transferase [Obelidium mucronatum]